MAVYTYWAAPLRQHHKPFRLLAYMALVAKDADERPRWWGGRDMLLEALGREPDGSEADRRAGLEAVSSAITTLRKHGAVTVAERGRNGKRAEYFLHLRGPADAAVAPGSPCSQRQAQPVAVNRLSLTKQQAHPAVATGSPWSQGEQEPQGTPEESSRDLLSSHLAPSIDEAQDEADECVHGTPGGRESTRKGQFLCPLCRHADLERRAGRRAAASS